MATPDAQEHPLEGGQEPGRSAQDAPRPTPATVEPLRPVPSRSVPPPASLPARRSQPPAPKGPRRVGLFQKILLGDLTLWCVLSAVLTYEVFRQQLPPEHALFGALAGFTVALAVAGGLEQVAHPGVQPNPSPLGDAPGAPAEP